jgi:DNA-binding response OmpR family regulator
MLDVFIGRCLLGRGGDRSAHALHFYAPGEERAETEEKFRGIRSWRHLGYPRSRSGATMRILVVEDERKVADTLRSRLESEGHDVITAATGREGLELSRTRGFDLIVLDRMLPGCDGLEILADVRRRDRDLPVLVLTARDAIADRVAGLDAGADDYLVKPFALVELLARVRALLRRGNREGRGKREPVSSLRFLDLEMDLLERRAMRGGRTLGLTAREFDLLAFLLKNQGQAVARRTIAREVWKETARADSLDNVIDVHVGRLRKKLDDPFPTRLLRTVRGLGFVLDTSLD